MLTLNLKPSWHTLSVEKKNMVTSRLLDTLEVSDKKKRMNAAKSVLYLLQVCFSSIFSYIYIIIIKCVTFRDVGQNVNRIEINK